MEIPRLFPVTVWNRDASKAEGPAAHGASLAATAADAARDADIVFTMLSDGSAVGQVLFEAGVAEVLKAGDDSRRLIP